MTDIFVGSVSVGVVPDARGWNDKMRQQIVEPSRAIGDEAGTEMGKGIVDKMGKAGDDSGGAFEREFKKKIKAALATLPKAQLDGDSTEIDRKMEEIRLRIKALHDAPLLDASKAGHEIDKVMLDLEKLRLSAGKDIPVDIKYNMDKAMEQLFTLRSPSGSKTGLLGVISKDVTNMENAANTMSGATSASASVFSNFMGFFGKMFGGGGAGGVAEGVTGGAGGAASGGGALAPLAALLPGPGLAAIIGIIVASLPFILQMAGSMLIGTFGAGIAGLGLLGASKNKGVTVAFTGMMKAFSQDMITIGAPMIPVLKALAMALKTTFTALTPVLTQAEAIIAGPLSKFLTTLVGAFAQPSVQTAIIAVADAFAAMLTSLTAAIAKNVSDFAGAITALANTIAANPQAFTDFVNFLATILIDLVRITNAGANAASWLEKNPVANAAIKALGFGGVFGPFIPPGFSGIVNGLSGGGGGGGGTGGQRQTGMPPAPGFGQSSPFLNAPAPGASQATAPPNWHVFHHIATAVSNQGISQALSPPNIIPGQTAGPSWDVLGHVKNVLSDQSINHMFSVAGKSIGHWATVAVGWGNSVIGGMLGGMGHIWNSKVSPFFTTTIPNNLHKWWSGAINWLTGPGGRLISGLWKGISNFWTNTITPFFTTTVPNNVHKWWSGAINWLTGSGGDLITGLWHGISSFWTNTITPFFTKTVPQNVTNWFNTAITWLTTAGGNIIHGLFNGMKAVVDTVGSWLNTYVWKPIETGAISFFQSWSPSRKMIPLGKAVVQGVIHGMIGEGKVFRHFVGKIFGGWPEAIMAFMSKGLIKDASKLGKQSLAALGGALGIPAKDVVSYLGGYAGKFVSFLGKMAGQGGSFFTKLFGGATGGGITQWAGVAAQALKMLRLPASLTRQVLYQIGTESGGNPNAVNLWDINAKRGDPSRGLLQTTGGTFTRYHVPGTSLDIFDPLANVAAAINYALHTYGPNLMRGGSGLGSGHGYDTGGWLPPGVTMAYNLTGKPEAVLTQEQLSALSNAGGPQYHAHFDGLTGAAIESHVRTAFMTMSLTQGALQRQGRRS